MQEDLSVCITTYNRWPLCLNALKSVYGQENVKKEVILVDDCSTDPIPDEVVNFIRQKNTYYIRHETNRGLAAARNTAIKQSSGKYFTFCDDDMWPDEFAKRMIKTIDNAKTDIGIVLGLNKRFKPYFKKYISDYPSLRELIIHGVTPPVGAQLYKNSLLKQVGGYNEMVKSGVDHDIWFSLARLNPKVAICWGNYPIVSLSSNTDRITLNEKERYKNINDALLIWKPQIVDIFGENFFHHFYKCYQVNLDYTFFKHNIKQYNFLEALTKLNNISLVRKIMKSVAIKMRVISSIPSFENFE